VFLHLPIKNFVAIFKAKPMKTYDPNLNTIFVILGFLNDDMGRLTVQGRDIIEEFYSAENDIADK
jgi:hypothetical protein